MRCGCDAIGSTSVATPGFKYLANHVSRSCVMRCGARRLELVDPFKKSFSPRKDQFGEGCRPLSGWLYKFLAFVGWLPFVIFVKKSFSLEYELAELSSNGYISLLTVRPCSGCGAGAVNPTTAEANPSSLKPKLGQVRQEPGRSARESHDWS